MDAETKELVLANRQFVWSLVARGFAEEPDRTFAAIVASEHARAEVALADDEMTAELVAAYDALAAFFAPVADGPDGTRVETTAGGSDGARVGATADGPVGSDGGEAGGSKAGALDAALATARVDYVRIFVGPNTLAAFPWETMHTTGKRMLFHRDVLSVRDAYREAGFLPERYRQVADDAIGLECDFMAKLAVDALAAFQEDDARRCQDRLLQSLTFLTDHLLRWIDSLADAIETHYGATFYAVLARFTALWCRRDEALVSALFVDLGSGGLPA